MADQPTPTEYDEVPAFADRHIGPRAADVATMLDRLGFESLDALMDAAVPGGDPLGGRARPAAPAHRGRPSTRELRAIARHEPARRGR